MVDANSAVLLRSCLIMSACGDGMQPSLCLWTIYRKWYLFRDCSGQLFSDDLSVLISSMSTLNWYPYLTLDNATI